MKKYLVALSIVFIIQGIIGFAFAATGNKETIYIAGTTYSLDICNKKDVLKLKISLINLSTSLSNKEKNTAQRLFNAYTKRWNKKCKPSLLVPTKQHVEIAKGTPQQLPKGDVSLPKIIIKDIEILDSIKQNDRQKRIDLGTMYKEKITTLIPQFYYSGYINKDTYNLYISKELSIVYKYDCKNTALGSTYTDFAPKDYKVTDTERQYFYGTNFWINLCNADTTFSYTPDYVIVHEFGHFIQSILDPNYLQFKDMCWKSGSIISGCKFVSQYAKTNYIEDYAETFTYWYLGLSYDTTSVSLQQKMNYFNNLFKR